VRILLRRFVFPIRPAVANYRFNPVHSPDFFNFGTKTFFVVFSIFPEFEISLYTTAYTGDSGCSKADDIFLFIRQFAGKNPVARRRDFTARKDTERLAAVFVRATNDFRLIPVFH